MTPGGLPHSGIHGSAPADGSPWHIAAFHALHRLVAPRHPPCALNSSAPRIALCRANRIELNRISHYALVKVYAPPQPSLGEHSRLVASDGFPIRQPIRTQEHSL